jgi:hypothetical protein
MQTIEIKKGISIGMDDLAQRLSELDMSALTHFFEQLNEKMIGSSQAVVRKGNEEVILLKKIKTLLPKRVTQRYYSLIAKDAQQSLAEKERQEMMLLIEFMENKCAERLHLMHSLAQLRGITVPQLLKQLPIQTKNPLYKP